MKKSILILLLLVFFTSHNSYSQNKTKKDRFKTLKIGFITETLDLNVEEAEKFWPIYNKHQLAINTNRNSEKLLLKSCKENGGIENLTDKDAEKLLKNLLEFNDQKLSNRQKLYSDLKGILSSKQLLKLHRAERDFNRKILEQYKKRRYEKHRSND